MQRSTRNNVLTFPTALERTGDFSQSRNAAGQLITIYDPLTTRPNPTGTGFIRDPFPGNVIPARSPQPDRAGDAGRHAAADHRPLVHRLGDARRRPAGPGDAEDRSPVERQVDDHRHVWPPVHQGAGLGVLGSARHDPGRSRAARRSSGRSTSSRPTRSSSRTTPRRWPSATATTASTTTAPTTPAASTPRSLGYPGVLHQTC